MRVNVENVMHTVPKVESLLNEMLLPTSIINLVLWDAKTWQGNLEVLSRPSVEIVPAFEKQ